MEVIGPDLPKPILVITVQLLRVQRTHSHGMPHRCTEVAPAGGETGGADTGGNLHLPPVHQGPCRNRWQPLCSQNLYRSPARNLYA